MSVLYAEIDLIMIYVYIYLSGSNCRYNSAYMLEWDRGTAASMNANAYTFQSEQNKELLLWKNGPIFHRLAINKAKK